MPKVIKADWNLAKELVLKGLGIDEAATAIGVKAVTLRSRCYRQGWKAEIAKNAMIGQVIRQREQREAIEGAPNGPQTSGQTRMDIGTRLRDTMLRDSERVAAALEGHMPEGMTLEELEMRERVATSVQKRGLTAAGLDSIDGQSNQINILVLDALNVSLGHPEGKSADQPNPIVDVAPEPKAPE